MRYLEVRIEQETSERHPMHQFVVDHRDYEQTRLLSRNQYSGDSQAALFHVDGPTTPFANELADRSSVIDFEIAPCPDGSFYLYVSEEMEATERAFAGAFDQPGLLILPPIEYRADGAVVLTAVGPAKPVQTAVRSIPDMMNVEILGVGEFLAGRLDSRLELTPRQGEAVNAAVASGYYHEPRDATLEDVAARLDCSTGTAGELLRRAERTVMTRLATSESD